MALAPSAPAQPTAQQALALGLKYGPNAGVALSRSAYLADALQQLQAEASHNVRTPLALGANLLATALMHYGKENADREAMGAYQRDQDALDKTLTAGTPLDPSYQPPAPAASAAAAPAATPATPDAAAPMASSNGPQLAAALSGQKPNVTPQDLDAAARMMVAEAGGEGPIGEQAAGAVAFNRLRQGYGGAKSLSDVVYQKHQFEGMTSPRAQISADTPQYQEALQIAQSLANGDLSDPTNGAINFINPELQAKLGRPLPTWAQGQGERIGNHVFFGGQPQTQAAQAQPAPGAPAQPYQIAANGPTPPPPGGPATPPEAPPAVAAPAPPVPPPAGGAGAASPALQVVTPQEWATAQALLANPQTRELGRQKVIELKMRAATPADPSKPYWGADGRAHYAPGTESTITPGALPGSYLVRSPQNDLKVVNEPNLTNAPPAGYDRDPRDPNRLIPQGTGSGLPVPSQAPAQAPGGAPQAKGPAPIPPALQKPYMDMVDAYHKGPGYTDYSNGVNAANALEANLKAALGNNTIVDQAAIDNLIRTMTGLSARQNSVNAVLEHLPWSEQLKGFVAKAIGPDGASGYITPKVVQQMRTAVHAYAEGHRALAEQEYQQYNTGANRMGFDLGLTLPDIPTQGPIKWLDEANTPRDQGQVLQEARQAIARGADPAKVRQRLQSMGVDPRGL